jgi:hypothetical protein
MGAVYLARERFLERMVAVKVLIADATGSSDSRERFRREARTAAKLTHPNIVPLHTFGEARGLHFFVMGFVQGESLADRLRREGRLPPDEARRIMAELADALDYAHRQGVVHRDIKPDNILLDDSTGRPMLTDFGVAKASSSGQTLTVIGTIVGTPQYMSPEQAAGDRDVDGRSDLYSLGLLGYAMLSGRPPFAGLSVQDTLVQQVTKEPPPLRAIVPDLPADLELAIARCLPKDPAQRWPDGRSLKGALAGEAGAEDLPEHLEALPSFGFVWVFLSYITAHVALGLAVAGKKEWRFVAGMTLVWHIPWITAGIRAKRAGATWRQVLRLLFRPPRWWVFPWPRALLRPDDFRARLPRTIRILRAFVYWPMLMLIAVMGVYITVRVSGVRPTGALRFLAKDAFPYLFYIPYFGSLIGMSLWARRKGLKRSDAAKLWGRPALPGAFWKRPEIARLLEPVVRPQRTSPALAPKTPHEMLRAIADAAQSFSGPAREAGTEAVVSARRLVTSLEEIDREIEGFDRDADVTELQRLEQRIAALGDASPGEPESHRQMRTLLTSQRDLVGSLLTQREAAQARRARLLRTVETLWRRLDELRATPTVSAVEITSEVRALCESAAREVSTETLTA